SSGRMFLQFRARTWGAELWVLLRPLTRKKAGLIPKSNRMTYCPHGVKVEAKVVDGVQNLAQNFVGGIEMPQISTRIAHADATAAIGVERAVVSGVSCLLDRDFPL